MAFAPYWHITGTCIPLSVISGHRYRQKRPVGEPGGGDCSDRRRAGRWHDHYGEPRAGHDQEDNHGQCQWLRSPPCPHTRHRVSAILIAYKLLFLYHMIWTRDLNLTLQASFPRRFSSWEMYPRRVFGKFYFYMFELLSISLAFIECLMIISVWQWVLHVWNVMTV